MPSRHDQLCGNTTVRAEMKPPNYAIDDIKALHRNRVEPRLGAPHGASENDISELEGTIGHRFPSDYREFLLLFGRDYDGAFGEMGCFVDGIVRNTQLLPGIVRKHGFADLSPGHYVSVFYREKAIYGYFALPTDHDDPLGYFIDDRESPAGITCSGTILSYFLRHLENFVRRR
ncbi:MAG: SMI1/KNR4 family protein [Verrucomicrobiota bacterium]